MEQKRTSGILLHPTSLPSAYGIGDFGKNSFQFVDVLKKGKQTLWQMLPLCPVDSTDSPYQSPSAFAGEPLLIDLEKLIDLSLLKAEEVDRVKTHDQGKTDYALARKIKRPLFQLAFERFQENEKVFEIEFRAFIKKQAHWLEGYALFMAAKNYFVEERAKNTPEVQKERADFVKACKNVLKADEANNYFNGASWVSFPKELRDFDAKAIVEYKKKFANEYNYYVFLQFLFDMQWTDLKVYANKNNVKIVGDLPIFVSYDSADVWQNQKDFILDKMGFPVGVAGVPPDYFSATGQLWGNPLYNFKNQKKNKFEWWYLRLKKAFEVSDIVRLDHFRGFESFWQVPFGAKDARAGEWVKSAGLPFFKEMEKRFDMEELPIIAEDLGVITEEVQELKKATGFPGMAILQFAFGSNGNVSYLPHMHEQNMVVYTGTHDNNTTKGWYGVAPEDEKDHYRRYMNTGGESPSWDFIRLAFSSTANTVIIPLQDVMDLGSEACMNKPGTATDNWNFNFEWHMLEEGQIQGLAYFSELFGRNQEDKEVAKPKAKKAAKPKAKKAVKEAVKEVAKEEVKTEVAETAPTK